MYGIGPVIVFGQLLIAGGAIAISYKFKWDCYEYEMLNIPLKIIGVLSVIFGLYLNYSAKHISNLFENVSENRLIQDGIYGYVRNPVYSAANGVNLKKGWRFFIGSGLCEPKYGLEKLKGKNVVKYNTY